MSQHCRANPCCGDVPCRGVPVPQHASGYTSFNPPASTDLREENERLKAEAESMRARAEAADDEIHAIADHLDCESDRDSILHAIGEIEADLSISKDRATALKERLQRVEGLVQRAKAILPQFYEDWHECVAAALAREGK